MVSDPRLAYQVYFGPATPCQYRLFGPHSWAGARKAIMATWERVYAPMKTRNLQGTDRKNVIKPNMLSYMVALVVLTVAFLMILQ